MCGILGFYSSKGMQPYRQALQAANNIIAHRGPDGAGFALFRGPSGSQDVVATESLLENSGLENCNLVLGHRRLAIIDLTASGFQPMCNRDRSLWITYNGEVYNYIELRDELKAAGHTFVSTSDTEVILHAYQEWGDACVTRFNGIWSFAIADLERQRLFCSRDRLGVKPFYYYSDGQHFVFGSEIKQLLCFPFVPKQKNERAIYEFLAFAAVEYGDETFFAGISKLMQGCNLIFDWREFTVKIAPYYQPQFETDDRISAADAAAQFRYLLADAVRLQLRSDVEVGSCLSGGLDSSSIVCLMHDQLLREGKSDIQHTFSSHFEEKDANELEYMQEVIARTGVDAKFTYPTPADLVQDLERLVWHQEEPFGSTSIFAQWSVFKLIHANQVKVVLDGQGADEQLAGYIGLYPYYLNELYDKRQWLRVTWEAWRYHRLHGQDWFPRAPGMVEKALRLFYHPQPISQTNPVEWINPDLAARHYEHSQYIANQQVKHFGETDHLDNILYQLTFLNNLQSLLKYEDRNSMAFSVEARVPFLDHRLVEFIFSLPPRLKIRNGYTKRVLRDGMQGILPEKIRWRVGKLGFATPEKAWQRQVLRPMVEQALMEDSLRPYLLVDGARAYLDQVEQKATLDSTPWRWLNVHLWGKAYGID